MRRCGGIWPSFSPDGSAVESAGGVGRLIRSPGEEAAPVSVSAVEDCPAWAPDGTQLVGVRGGDLVVVPAGIDLETLKTGGVSSLYFTIDQARFLYREVLTGAREGHRVAAAAPWMMMRKASQGRFTTPLTGQTWQLASD